VLVGCDEGKIVNPILSVAGESPNLGGVNGGLDMDLGHPWSQVGKGLVHPLPRSGSPIVIEVIGEDHPFLRGEFAEWESGLFGGDGGWQANR
jgi:hypothetical protein